MIHEGQQLGDYTLIRKLGRGGFGEVWLGEKDSQFFAVKLQNKDDVNWKQITQEIGLWLLCGKHSNLVPIIEARNFKSQIAIVSEYVRGGSLEDLLRQKGKFAVEEAIEVTIGILNGLKQIHENGIIHRDLKPANILLDGNTPRLTDFGISRVISSESLSDTISGTWAYMAPECFDGKRNIQTDIWSVGVILYQLLSGRLPFPQKEHTELIGAIIMREPEILENKKLQAIVSKALTKKPEERFPSVADLIDALQTLSRRSDLAELIPYRKGDKWGFCDRTKKVLIEPKYDVVGPFDSGLARAERDREVLFVDSSGNEILLNPYPLQLSLKDDTGRELLRPAYSEVHSFHDGFARVRLDATWRFLDKTGAEVLFLSKYDRVGNFSDGVAIAQRNSKYFFLDKKGHEISGLEFDEKPYFEDKVIVFWKAGRAGLIDKSARILVPPQYDKIGSFHGGLANIWLHGKCGVIDENGIEIIQPKFEELGSFAEGLAGFCFRGKQGFINLQGEIVVEPIYDLVAPYREGRARVKIGEKYGFIDTCGKQVIPVQFDLSNVYFAEGIIGVQKNGDFFCIDYNGNQLFSLASACGDFSDGLAHFKKDDSWGFIDKTGTVAIKPAYDDARPFKNGVARVKVGDLSGFIDRNGDVTPRLYDAFDLYFHEGLARVRLREVGWGFIDEYGNEVGQLKYYSVEKFDNGLALVYKTYNDYNNNRGSYIDRNGIEYFED